MQHIGQGANQAFEDIYHLVRLLNKHNPTASPPSTEVLSSAFSELEQLRILRTSEFVKRARKTGELRVVSGVEECKKRNDILRTMFEPLSGPGGTEAAKTLYAEILEQPFADGQSEL